MRQQDLRKREASMRLHEQRGALAVLAVLVAAVAVQAGLLYVADPASASTAGSASEREMVSLLPNKKQHPVLHRQASAVSDAHKNINNPQQPHIHVQQGDAARHSEPLFSGSV